MINYIVTIVLLGKTMIKRSTEAGGEMDSFKDYRIRGGFIA